MLTFLIVAAIMLIVAYVDYKSFPKTRRKRQAVFYVAVLTASIVLAGLQCFGVNLYDYFR